MIVIEVVVGGGDVPECVILDKIIGKTFNIIHSNTLPATKTSVIHIK